MDWQSAVKQLYDCGRLGHKKMSMLTIVLMMASKELQINCADGEMTRIVTRVMMMIMMMKMMRVVLLVICEKVMTMMVTAFMVLACSWA